ncbi:MAG: M20/M25/M40 family metallo-hydrolase [Steroidobacteraceae bacterium]
MCGSLRIPAVVCAVMLAIPAAGEEGVLDKVQEYRRAHESEILSEFRAMLSIPNYYRDAANIRRNADFIAAAFRKRGVATRLLEIPDAPPVVYGELLRKGAQLTIGVYAHYDGQAVAQPDWRTSPFEPKLLDALGQEISIDATRQFPSEARLYARSAGDDKAPIQAVLAALDALKAAGIKPVANLKFLFEGEEEPDSPHLQQILGAHPEVLRADIWLLSDGPIHPSRQMQVYFGARGERVLDITAYGPAHPIHSGHYGNWAPNPIVLLTRLLASMRDEDGRILIKGLSDGVRSLTAAEEAVLERAPSPDDALRAELQLAQTEGDGAPLARRILLPAVNLIGIRGGHVGADATNIISTEAVAAIDFRFVPDQTLDSVEKAVERHVRDQGFFIVRETPDAETRRRHARIVKLSWRPGYAGFRTSPDLPQVHAVVRAVALATGREPIEIVGVGATVPMFHLSSDGRVPVIGLPIANHDNNQHAANENVRLQNLWDGIAIFAAIFTSMDAGEAH